MQIGDTTVDVTKKVTELWFSLVDSYRYMEMSVNKYVLLILFPAFITGGLMGALSIVTDYAFALRAPMAGAAVFMPIAALMYPKVQQDRKRKQISEKFHLFVTHLTVLSTTNIERIEIFRTLAQEDDYGALADEMAHLVALIDTWNQSLDDACRMRAKKVPSPLLTDFYERLAYTVGAGQEISEFLLNEQDAIIQEYTIRYENDLANLDVMKDLYMSMMLSATFALAFGIILPILTGINPIYPVGGIIALFVLVEVAFLIIINNISPYDPLWFHSERITRRDKKMLASIGGGWAVALLLGLGVLASLLGITPIPRSEFPLPIWMAIPVTPLLIPGLMMRREEQNVKERNGGFGSFIRALGSVESIKQTSTSNVLKTLRRKDFGSLTENIDNLYKRLNTRIDSNKAWSLFAIESGSYLIYKFSKMYVFARQMGGEPRRLGHVINTNMGEILKLREKRKQATTTMTGVIYGLTAANTFAFFVSLQIVGLLVDISDNMDLDNGLMGEILYVEAYNILQIEYLLLVLILLNALLSSIMIRLTDRGHFVNSFIHLVLLTWLGSIIAVVTNELVSGLL